MSEICLVVKTDELFNFNQYAFTGFKRQLTLPKLNRLTRNEAETNFDYKQLVSYIVCKNEQDEFLVYKRLKGSGESRLHNQLSIGIGGHMNPIQPTPKDLPHLLEENALRELQEELSIQVPLKHIGYINDDSNEVGRVHLGVVYLATVKPEDITITETDTLSIEWLPAHKIDTTQLENWSKFLLPHIH